MDPTLTPIPTPTSIMPTPTFFPTTIAPFDVPDADVFGIEIANGAVQIWNTVDNASGLMSAMQAIILFAIIVGGILMIVHLVNQD